jgi:hypothetical protein
MPEPSSPKPKKLLDQLREAIRIKHYSYSTSLKSINLCQESVQDIKNSWREVSPGMLHETRPNCSGGGEKCGRADIHELLA